MKRIGWFILLCAILECQAQAPRDTLYFINGGKVLGEIKKVKLGVITFDPDDANDMTVQLKKLKTIAAVSRLYRIESTQHKVYFGKMLPSDSLGYTVIATAYDTVLHRVEQISVLYPVRSLFKERLTGNVKVGFDFTRSSGFGRLNYDARINYTAKKVEINFSISGIYSITDSSLSRDREDISLKNNYYFNTTWFGTLLGKYQRNLELGLYRRYQEGIGGGNKFITSRNVYAWTRCGVVFNQEQNEEKDNSGTLTELFGQLEFNFFRFTKPEVSINLAETFYYSLSQKGRLRNDAQLNLSWELVKDLDLTLTAYTNYDNQPPSADSKRLDFGFVFGLGFSF